MAEQKGRFREGQAVSYKGRPARFLYYVRDDAAAIRFSGRRESTVVRASSLAERPANQSGRSGRG